MLGPDPMAEFFVNYARANNDPYLRQFVEDLSEVVRDRRGLKKNDEVGFFDQQDIELGADWDATIVGALRTASTLVSLASPAFFKSEYCGRERALFRRRFAAGTQPPLIKPIVWIPFNAAHLPATFQASQFTVGDPDAVQNTKGVKYMMQQIQKYKVEYTAFVADFGAELIAAADQHALPPLANAPALGTIPPEWGSIASAKPAAAAASGPKHVRFVYFAFDPASVGPARLKEPYQEVGGVDWKPFYPDPTPIHLFAQKTVIGDELGFTSDCLPFDDDLLEQITAAWDARQIVVIVIDPWSLHWDTQTMAARRQQLLNALDRQNGFHWCVMVPWNEQDPDLGTEPQRTAIASTVINTFPFHGRLNKNPMFFRDGIKTLGELRQALTEVLPRLKDEIRKQAEVMMPIPEGPTKVVMRSAPSTGQ
jgi:FxsC-like protein